MNGASAPEDGLVCSCCARSVSPSENVWRHEVPYPGDFGTGLCLECGGDRDARDPRKKLGRIVCEFVDARIPLVALLLSEENRVHFQSLEYERQADFVLRCVEKGRIP